MSKQITAMEDYQKENERLREENARLKNSPTPEELDTASIANEAKNQRIRELEKALRGMKTAFAIQSPLTPDDLELIAEVNQLLNQKQ